MPGVFNVGTSSQGPGDGTAISTGPDTYRVPVPTAGVLPDITVFGAYTYLVTELLWGTVALALVAYAGAWRSAARTVAILYPPAFLWDWYTLEVGVFAIPLRTGVELLGVPLEEHIFILVVPTMVVGTHETLRILDREGRLGPLSLEGE